MKQLQQQVTIILPLRPKIPADCDPGNNLRKELHDQGEKT